MCGIAGIYRYDGGMFDPAHVKKMGDALAHRGPDDHRYLLWTQEGGGHRLYRHELPAQENAARLAFAHRRLSIVDISGGHQPMTNEDGTLWVCYNGEIYNHADLRACLQAEGHVYTTHSDTETLLHLYESQGVAGFEQLNGIFAFALWDSRQQTLWLVRDRFGVKPLYYGQYDGMLFFASEIKAILTYPAFPRRPDAQAITEHFTFQNHFGDKTFWQDVRLLPSATWLACQAGGNIRTGRYWAMRFQPHEALSESEASQRLRFYFEQAVNRQLMSEVPLGTFLSGGMDTGSISAVAVKSLPHLHTFTCGFELPPEMDDLEQYFDESAASFDLADRLGTQHHEIRLDAGHNFPVMAWVAWALDEPRLGISYQNWYTSQLVRRYVTVVLGGGGGDELFAGYPWRHMAILDQHEPQAWNLAYYQQWIRFLDDEQKSSLFSSAWQKQTAGFSTYDGFLSVMADVETNDPLSRALYFDFHTFLHGLLVVEDKLSMAHSIEARVPFLDNDFVDFVLTLPSTFKLRNGESKYLLKRAMRGLLPEETLARRKQGFTPPDATWYRGVLRPQVEGLLLSERALGRGYFQPEGLRQLINQHMEGQRNHRFLLWSLMIFEWWNRLFLDGDSLPELPKPVSETSH